MPKAKANNIEIEYDTFGDPSGKPLLLVMGLGAHMIEWLEEFCEAFVDKGFFVIRFDNRDVGLSTKFEDAGMPDIQKAIGAAMQRKPIDAPYLLDDMANDAVGLLDALGIEKAHICGASMGGMIVQTIAINHPSRVLSLASIMSTTGDPTLPQATPKALKILMTPLPQEREAYIEESLKIKEFLYGTGYTLDKQKAREIIEQKFDRCFYPVGFARQLVAILASGDRTEKLASIKVPTVVLHGNADPLVPVEGGKATAKAIPGAKLVLFDGVGHSIPTEVAPQYIDEIAENAAKASN